MAPLLLSQGPLGVWAHCGAIWGLAALCPPSARAPSPSAPAAPRPPPASCRRCCRWLTRSAPPPATPCWSNSTSCWLRSRRRCVRGCLGRAGQGGAEQDGAGQGGAAQAGRGYCGMQGGWYFSSRRQGAFQSGATAGRDLPAAALLPACLPACLRVRRRRCRCGTGTESRDLGLERRAVAACKCPVSALFMSSAQLALEQPPLALLCRWGTRRGRRSRGARRCRAGCRRRCCAGAAAAVAAAGQRGGAARRRRQRPPLAPPPRAPGAGGSECELQQSAGRRRGSQARGGGKKQSSGGPGSI